MNDNVDIGNSIKLAYIDLTRNKKKMIIVQFPEILSYFKGIDDIPDSDDFSVFSPNDKFYEMREDKIIYSLKKEDVLKNVPLATENFF